MLKIGLFGAGHLGKIHLQCIQNIENYRLVGFYDPDDKRASDAINHYGIKRYTSPHELIRAVDVVDIVSTTLSHYEIAMQAIEMSKHCFIEKPIAANVEEATTLESCAEKKSVKIQIGHVERFNPAFTAAHPFITHPMFIESHRLAQFNPRGSDVSVILDLMIHDIDIVLHVVDTEIADIHASGVAVVSDTPDIANARISFKNGCVANLTASRISIKNMRKTRFFQKDTYISVDFLDKQAEIIRLQKWSGQSVNPLAMTIDLGEQKGKKEIIFEKANIQSVNAIKEELRAFYKSIIKDTRPRVNIQDGVAALIAAHLVVDKVQQFKKNIKP